MGGTAEYRVLIRKRLIPVLEEHGFEKTSGLEWQRVEDADSIWNCHIGSPSKANRMRAVVSIAIRFPRVNQILSDAGILDSDLDVGAIYSSLGNLRTVNKCFDWPISDDTDVPSLVDGIVRDFIRIGMPFLERYGTLRNFITAVENSSMPYGDVNFDLTRAAAYVVLGDTSRAIEVLRENAEHYLSLYNEKEKQSDRQIYKEYERLLLYLMSQERH